MTGKNVKLVVVILTTVWIALFANGANARFLQPDPIGLKSDINLYNYVHNDPLDRSDPPGTQDSISTYNQQQHDSGQEVSPAQASANAHWVSTHPGEVIQAVGGAVSLIPTPATRAVGGGISATGAAVRMTEGGTAVPITGGRTDFVVGPNGTAFPVPAGASGPTPSINPAGAQTGVAYTGGSGGANGQVATMRVMQGNAKNPGGYVKYENANPGQKPQPVDPNSGRTIPQDQAHHPIN